MPYSMGSRLISIFAARPLLQGTIFKGVLLTMSKCKKLLAFDQSERTMVRRHIVSTSADPWRIWKLSSVSEHEYKRWITVRNGDLIRSKQAQGQGVLLVTCHIGMSRILPLAMNREGIDVTTLESTSYYRNKQLPGADTFKTIETKPADGFYLKVLFQAREVLNNSGVLLMAPDGRQGMGEGKQYPFLGKKRTFFGGFAALAEKTNSVVILSNITVHDNGFIDIELEECPRPLCRSQDEVIVSLVDQYVNFVENLWKTDVTKVKGRHIAYYLSL
jgi:lauroyl/myristoyl acyltransferase